jgi:tetratricopeptide (TPR) repeat protein
MAAYRALNANHIDEAETRFKAILASDPGDPKALAGMGYVRMQQGNFSGAISYLEQARLSSASDQALATALDTARFWFLMGEGQRALNQGDLTTAEKNYRAALGLRSTNPEALVGLGGTLLKAQQPGPAIPLFERVVAAEPASAEGWRGLCLAQYQAGNASLALATEKRIPATVRDQLMKDPLFLQTMASAYAAVGRSGDAQKALESALELPPGAEAKGAKAGVAVQLAGIQASANHLDEAAKLYAQAVAENHGDTQAWEGLVRVQHALGHNGEALKSIEAMPSESYDAATRDPGFAVVAASVYQAAKRLDVAQDLLQTALTQQTSAGQKPSAAIEMQLADVYVERGSSQFAYPIYQQVIAESPDRADAWAGLLSALHATGHDQEAADQEKSMPAAVRAQLEKNVSYQQTMASVYKALGQTQAATAFVQRAQQEDAAQRASPAMDLEIQNAWLLFNRGDDTGLYRQLMALGERSDLTREQRRTVQTIWTNWAARRANQAAAAGNTSRALAILNAAARAFPDDPAAFKALANGYAQAGEPQQAVTIYKAQNMTSASAADYEAAVGAALAAGDNKDAETWLRSALAAYAADPQILILGAKYEQARGDTARAIKYYRASLQAMPPPIPDTKLAAELGLPVSTTPMRLPSPEQPQDISRLLAPGVDDREPVPGYGNGNASGSGVPASYDDTTPVVPPYMSNPVAQPGSGGQSSLPNGPPPAEVASTVRTASAQALGQAQPTSQVVPQAPAAQPATQGGQVYGPFVPYAPPARPAGQAASANGPAVSVQLGNNTPHPAQPQADVTDVLPTARYSPSARANQAAASQADVAAAQAARIRKLQAESNAAKAAQAQAPAQKLVPQPATPPASGIGNIPDTGAQQYPQPRTPPGANPAQAAAVPAPVPAQPVAAAPAVPVAASLGSSSSGAGQTPNPQSYAPYYPLTHGPTDAELIARNLPAGEGPYGAQAPIPLTPRQQVEQQLASLEGSYSGWLGATGIGRYRSGTLGLDRLNDIETPVEASIAARRAVRLTAVALPVFLNSGTLNPSSFTSGNVPYLGTLAANTANSPAQQYANGIGGELQLTAKDVGVATGYTPYDFPVRNLTGSFRWRPLGGAFSLSAGREPVKDTQLSYAGLHDPGAATSTSLGPVWGGVIATTGGARLDFGGDAYGFYLFGDGGVLTGRHVLNNSRYDGATGATFRVANLRGRGSLTVGGALFGMRYIHNEVGLTYGQGGYFSPAYYFLASAPVTLSGSYKSNFHYLVSGALGFRTFQQNAALFYPLDPSLQSSFVAAHGGPCSGTQTATYSCGVVPLTVTTGFNYEVNAEAAYRFREHWYGGWFFSGNNTNNYNNLSGGFFFRYAFRAQKAVEGYPTGLFPVQGIRPLQIP